MKKGLTLLLVVVVIASVATLIQYIRASREILALNPNKDPEVKVRLPKSYFPFNREYNGSKIVRQLAVCRCKDGTISTTKPGSKECDCSKTT